MPTVSSKPTLQSTQIVGAILWDQFVREKITAAGLNESLVTEAERNEDTGLTIDKGDSDSRTENENPDHISACSTDSSSTLGNISDSTLNDHTVINNSTASHHNEGDLFQSISESVQENDRTVYHSMTNGQETSPFDSTQTHHIMASYGKELRRIALEFEQTRERQLLKQKANQVQLQDINKHSFFLLLKELFEGGVTRERIVVLFFFCTDVALMATSLCQATVVKLLGWSFSFIVNTVCRAVYELGGWDYELGVWHNVLFRQLPSILVSSCALLGICVLAVQLHKSLRA